MIETMNDIKTALRVKAEYLEKHANNLKKLADNLPQALPDKDAADLLLAIILERNEKDLVNQLTLRDGEGYGP